jgi:hypothetical protein
LVAGDGGLPAVEANTAHDLVDPVDDVGDDDRGLVALERLEELGERRLALLLARDEILRLLGGDRVLRQFQELAEEVEAGLLDVGVLLAQGVESLAELDEDSGC